MGLWFAVGAVVIACVLGLWWRFSNGRFRAARGRSTTLSSTNAIGSLESVTNSDVRAPEVSGLAALGSQFGSRATLVQFSTAFCQPCRATRQILSDVATMVDGVQHLEIDAESHLELVRELDIRRTPTVLILDADGVIRHRAVGQPRKADVIQAVGAVID